jgi:hypothetical protein
MIRLATSADISRIVELGAISMRDGHYAGVFEFNQEQSESTARKIIEGIGKVLLWEVDGVAVGLLSFILFPHFYSGEITAQEVMWYVIKEYRAGGAAMHLFWEAQRMAAALGAVKMQFTAPTEAVGAIYARYGYNQIEVCYQRSLSCQ